MKRPLWQSMSLPLLAFVLLAGSGCETDKKVDTGQIDDYFENNPYTSADRPEGYHYLRITPASADITYIGEVVRFQVDGGTAPYVWEVADSAAGSISPSRVNEALYTVKQILPNNVLVFDKAGRSGVADINGGLTLEALAATAVPSTLDNDGDRAVLTATGGSPPYRWYIEDAALGSLNTDGGASVTYTRNRPGDNSVRVTDADDNTVTVVIQQP